MVKVAEFKLNKFNSLIINTASLCASISAFFILYKLNNMGFYKVLPQNILIDKQILLLLPTLSVVVVLHELLHGIAYKMFGARLKFGIKHLNAYTIDTSGNLYTTIQMTVIMLLPLFALTPMLAYVYFLTPSFSFCLLMGILLNACGSSGDILLLLYIILKGRNCHIKDEKYGFSLYRQL